MTVYKTLGDSVAMPTTVRVVCNNTLTIALKDGVGSVKVPHSTTFDSQAVKRQLGIAVGQWDSFMYRMKTLAERKVKTHEAMNYLLHPGRSYGRLLNNSG